MKISPDLIPHTEFHTGSWLQNATQPGWYYFTKRQNQNHILNDQFIDSVDEPLRELVNFLHSRNIKTTPSCSGHYINEKDLGKIYDSLEEDCEKIRSAGLDFIDVESSKRYFYRDKNYSLPWRKENFLDKIEDYQHKGVLGIRAGNRKNFRQQILDMKSDGVITRERDSIVFIFTDEPGKNNFRWKEITERVKEFLK